MMTTTPKTLSPELEKTLTAIRDRAARMENDARAERLEAERAIKLARGTGDVTARAAAAVKATRTAPAVVHTLADKVEAVLRGPFAPVDIRSLATAVEEPVGRVLTHLKKLRATACPTRSREDAADAKQIYNLGTEDDPRWIWVVGDEGSPEELGAMVRKILEYRPSTFSELTLATGARRGRLSGRIVQLQREGERLDNVGGDDRTYRWFMPGKTKRKR